jgi:hypothetical protein
MNLNTEEIAHVYSALYVLFAKYAKEGVLEVTGLSKLPPPTEESRVNITWDNDTLRITRMEE